MSRFAASPVSAYFVAAAAPLALTFLVFHVPGWPKPYSWEYLGVSVGVAIVAGTRPGLVALSFSIACVLWLGVPRPVHPGVEMFVAIDLCLLALLHRWRRAQLQLAEALAEEDRRKDQFIAVLSHELRNPLAPIRYAVPVLKREALSDTGERAVTVIDRQVSHLVRLVDDLLDVSRITSGKIELRPDRVTLASIVAVAVEAASPAIAAAGLALETSIPEAAIWLWADPARLAQVLTNLLNNSAKYTPAGGRVALEAWRDGATALIRVTDTGTGIPADALPAVFEMFRQVRAPDDRQDGLGVGLALARHLVEMHGGRIEVQSAGVGQGAQFTIFLPAVVEAGFPQTPEASDVAQACTRKLRVLVVDDNADLVEMLAMMVTQAGHEVRKAYDGPAALSAALAYRPELVLLDIGLPGMSGIEVARELRGRPETAAARLVALTGWGQAHDRERTREAGFDDHLTKPTEAGTLERLMREMAQPR